MKHISVKMACLFCLLLLAMYRDFKSYKIGNHLILSGILMALIINLYEKGWIGILYWLSGVMIPVILLFPLFLIKGLGAGDIKLFSVVGGFCGIIFVLKSIVIAFFVAAIMSIIHLIRYKQVLFRLQHLVNYIQTVQQAIYSSYLEKTKCKIIPYYDVKKDGYKGVIHFSFAIFAAVLILTFLHISI